MELKLRTHLLLLVEDSLADAEAVEQMLHDNDAGVYQVLRVSRMSQALRELQLNQVDVVLLDLHLPDSGGIASVKSLRAIAGDIPIVVLTGASDEKLALACIDAGAQDYLSKEELHPIVLRRAIGYAITRLREVQIRDLQQTLDSLRRLSSETARTLTTASLARTGAVRERHVPEFDALVNDYGTLLNTYLDHLIVQKNKPREEMDFLITRLGDLGGGPRDLMDVHVAALDVNVTNQSAERGRALAVEGRLLALEMMGLLVDYYRIGQRRRFL